MRASRTTAPDVWRRTLQSDQLNQATSKLGARSVGRTQSRLLRDVLNSCRASAWACGVHWCRGCFWRSRPGLLPGRSKPPARHLCRRGERARGVHDRSDAFLSPSAFFHHVLLGFVGCSFDPPTECLPPDSSYIWLLARPRNTHQRMGFRNRLDPVRRLHHPACWEHRCLGSALAADSSVLDPDSLRTFPFRENSIRAKVSSLRFAGAAPQVVGVRRDHTRALAIR